MAFLLSIAFSGASNDVLMLVETGSGDVQIRVGFVGDAAAIGVPRLIEPKDHVSADLYPADLVADDFPVLHDARPAGSGWAALCHAVVTAVAESGLAAGMVTSSTADDVLQLDFQLATAAAAAPQVPRPAATGSNPALPTQTAASNVAAIQAVVSNPGLQNPVGSAYALMHTPDAFGNPKLVLAPFQSLQPGFPSVLIGAYDPNTGSGTIGTFSVLPAGAPLTPIMMPANIRYPSSNLKIDADDLTEILADDLADLLGFDFDQIDHDPAASQLMGAEVYAFTVGTGSQSGAANPMAGQSGQPQAAQPQADSVLPADAPVRDLDEVTAALAKAADANPELAAKLRGIQGLADQVKAKMTPQEPVAKPSTFFGGGFS